MNSEEDTITTMPNPAAIPSAMASAKIPLFTLPTELMLMVATNLGNGSYLAFSLTNRRMHEIFFSRLYTRREDEVAATVGRSPTITTTTSDTKPKTITAINTTADVADATTATTTTTTATTTTTTPGASDEVISRDLFNHQPLAPRVTNLHRAVHYGLWQRRARMIELAEWFGAPSLLSPPPSSFSSSSSSSALSSAPPALFVVEGDWVEIPLILAAEDGDARFVAFLLGRYAARLRVALGSGRMLEDVLLRAVAVAERGGGCYWGVLELLLGYVDERRPVRGRGVFESGLLGMMLRWGMLQPCAEHGGDGGDGGVVPGAFSCCFLWMMHLAVFKGMVRFVDVSKAELEDWIARLPCFLQGEVYDILASVDGCPLLWEEMDEE